VYHPPRLRFYLGVVDPGWLERPNFETVPLCVSRNRLMGYATEVRARVRWMLDSSAFTEIERHGRWTVSARDYARMAARWQRQIGRLDAAAVQDLMCEPQMLERTGLGVVQHQILTTRSLLELRDLEPGVPWMPVLQGWEPEDYLRHIDRYDRAGVDLTREPVVGLGSVCRRQDTDEAERVILALHRIGILVHAFGFSIPGLCRAGRYLHSSDSMAWSYAARFRPVRLPGCPHATCEYCPAWALQWRRQLVRALGNVI
jgi:hypothetical protein